MTIYGAPISTQRYQLQIYGCSTMKPNMSTVFSCNMSLKQVLVWSVDKDMLKNGVKYLKKTIYGAHFTMYGYQLQIYGYSRMETIMSTASYFNTSL